MPPARAPKPRPEAREDALELRETRSPGPEPIRSFEIEAARGVRIRLLDLGATLASVYAPDRRGRPGPLALDLGAPERWLEPHPHVGGIVGRFANRIARGRFELDGRGHQLPRNAGPHHLHGGEPGFDARRWSAEPWQEPARAGVRFALTSEHGEQGYPGRLEVAAHWTLEENGALRLELRARSDRPTVLNLTPHTYWNLADGGAGSALDHELELAASRYAEVDAEGIPTGRLLPVADTPLDFRHAQRIGARQGHALLAPRGGYDHPLEIDRAGPGLAFAARLRDPASGRTLELHTTQPCLQLYGGQHLDALRGAGGRRFGPGAGVCLEPQAFPDAPNQPAFPAARLDPGERWTHTSELRFGID